LKAGHAKERLLTLDFPPMLVLGCRESRFSFPRKEIRDPLGLAQWLMPVILATWEADIWKIIVQSQSEQVVHKTPSPK
jgi:hypothetical protein